MVWGDYWERFGDGWVDSIWALDPAPAEVIVATDRLLKLPVGWKQTDLREPYFWESVHHVCRQASYEYVAPVAIDDRMPVDGLADLVLEGDIIVSGHKDSDGTVKIPKREDYERAFDTPFYTLSGYAVFKKDVFERIPLRPIMWPDWVASIEYLQHGLDVRFEDRVRYHYTLHKDQHSRKGDFGIALKNVGLAQMMARNGGLKPGAVWPPEWL
jgi:hypothetical protein